MPVAIALMCPGVPPTDWPIISPRESTLVIGPGGTAVVDERWNLVVTVA